MNQRGKDAVSEAVMAARAAQASIEASPEVRRNAANGYVWAYRALSEGVLTVLEVQTAARSNPLVGWREGADKATADWQEETYGADSEGGDHD